MDIVYKESFIVLEKPVEIMITDTGAGINVLICGGDRSHIGSVAACSPDTDVQLITFPGHREDVICRKWAETLSDGLNESVVVLAGIHYDSINKEEIQVILDILDEKLAKILQHFSKNTLQIQNEPI